MENILFEQIGAKIIQMRNEGKFDRYRYEYLPSLIRGTEYDPNPHLCNMLYPVIDKPQHQYRYQRFYFSVFWQTPDTREWSPLRLKLEIFLNYGAFTKLEVGLFFEPDMDTDTEVPWLFHWKKLMNDEGKSVEQILHKFEHVFLEVPPARFANRLIDSVYESTENMPPPKLYFHSLLALDKIYKHIDSDDDRNTDREARALALAMTSHKRLGEHSLIKLLSQNSDLIQNLHNLEQRKKENISHLVGFI